MKIFCSGSCRLLSSVNNGNEKVIPIHSMICNNYIGINFLGLLHNTKQHIQFIKFINNEIILPKHILSKFLSSYSEREERNNALLFAGEELEPIHIWNTEDKKTIPFKLQNIKKQFYECDWYIFEISSIKLYKKDGFEVQYELTTNYNLILQKEEELLEDLIQIRKIISLDKKILFQTHFRPNIIYNDTSKTIEKREIIYNLVNSFCKKNKNTFIYDPSILLQKDNSLFDGDTHFTNKGYIENFNYIYNNYLIK